MYVIVEQAEVPKKLEILQESKLDDFNIVKFKALLMEADTPNRNRRIYPRPVLEEAINAIKPMMADRNFGGELDHPILTGSQGDIYRQQTLKYEKISHIITDMWWEGNQVYGIVETTPTPNGQILANLIRFGVKVGFSLRALGEVRPGRNGLNEVQRPLTLVAIDAVQNPSFHRAFITETISEQTLLTESAIASQAKYCYGRICFSSLDQLIEWRIMTRLMD